MGLYSEGGGKKPSLVSDQRRTRLTWVLKGHAPSGHLESYWEWGDLHRRPAALECCHEIWDTGHGQLVGRPGIPILSQSPLGSQPAQQDSLWPCTVSDCLARSLVSTEPAHRSAACCGARRSPKLGGQGRPDTSR